MNNVCNIVSYGNENFDVFPAFHGTRLYCSGQLYDAMSFSFTYCISMLWCVTFCVIIVLEKTAAALAIQTVNERFCVVVVTISIGAFSALSTKRNS